MKLGTMVEITNPLQCDEKLKKLKELGFDTCQLKYKPEVFRKEDAEIIKASADKYGIDICSIFAGFGDANLRWDTLYGHRTIGIGILAYQAQRIEYMRKTAEFASMLGIKEMIIHAGFVPNDPLCEDYANIRTAVSLLADYLHELDMDLLLETGCETPIVLRGLIEDIGKDNIFINFDPANILMYGYGNPNDALKVFGKYVRNMHGKDGCLPTKPFTLGEEKPMGEGMVDFKTAFNQLKEYGYDRYVIIEREISGEEQIADILKAKKYIESLGV